MRGSKIKQKALEDSLNELSKVIVPGARWDNFIFYIFYLINKF